MVSSNSSVKVLIGCPTHENYRYCLKEYTAASKNILCKKKTIVLVDNSPNEKYAQEVKNFGLGCEHIPYSDDVKGRIVASRNRLREICLDEGYDYFLSLEQDVIPPPEIVEKLLSHSKEIVSGVYYKYYNLNYESQGKIVKTQRQLMPLLWRPAPVPNKMIPLFPKDVDEPALIQVAACGLGCVLISSKVLGKVKFRVSAKEDAYDDMQFCEDVYAQGFSIWADTSMKCKHLILIKPVLPVISEPQ